MNVKVRIKKLRPGAKIPQYATAGSAAADLYCASDEPISIPPGETRFIPTGISVSPEEEGVASFVYARSGLASKLGIAPANCVGVIDGDYRGEIIVALRNSSDKTYTVTPGDRIAQLLFAPVLTAEFIEADELDDTARSSGGFGSTGIG